jgi:L-fuconolactonase
MSDPETAMLIDAHHHLWDPGIRDYPWMRGLRLDPIRRRYGLDELRQRCAAAGVEATVLVQTVSDGAETDEFLATAADSGGLVAGVVGWVDLTDPMVSDRLARLRDMRGGEHLVAVRHQVEDEPDPAWLLREDVLRGLAAVGRAGLAYDVLVKPPQLPAARTVVQRLPEVRFVLDHCAKPPIAAGGWEPWASDIAALAKSPNVACKISGLVTEAPWDDWDVAAIRPYVDHVVEQFGPDRLLFGSDWPVCELAATYDEVLELARAALGPLAPGETALVFGGTARRLYGLV